MGYFYNWTHYHISLADILIRLVPIDRVIAGCSLRRSRDILARLLFRILINMRVEHDASHVGTAMAVEVTPVAEAGQFLAGHLMLWWRLGGALEPIFIDHVGVVDMSRVRHCSRRWAFRKQFLRRRTLVRNLRIRYLV